MKLLSFLLLASSCWGAIAHVSNEPCVGSNSTTGPLDLAFTSNNGAGNIALMGLRIGAAGRTVTVTDSNGNAWAKDVTVDATGGSAGEGSVWHAYNIAAGANTVHVSISGAAASLRYCLAEFSGIATSSAFDTSGTGTGNGTAVTSGVTGTRALADEVLIGLCHDDNVAGNCNAGSGFTALGVFGCPSSDCLSMEYQIFSSTGTDAATFTKTSSSQWGAAAATYKAPSAATTSLRVTLLGVGP